VNSTEGNNTQDLDLKTLEEALISLPLSSEGDPIIGYIINPLALIELKIKFGIPLIPPNIIQSQSVFNGLKLYVDANIPYGVNIPIRKSQTEISIIERR
jgi:hypothetical protein